MTYSHPHKRKIGIDCRDVLMKIESCLKGQKLKTFRSPKNCEDELKENEREVIYKTIEELKLVANDKEFSYYASYISLSEFGREKEDIKNLVMELRDVLKEVMPISHYSDINLWIGTNGSFTPCHQDTYDNGNFSIQLSGEKNWILIPPNENNEKYMNRTRIPFEDSTIFTKINFHGKDLIEELKLNQVTYFQEFSLTPKEMLHIPARWWHFVSNGASHSLSICINIWNDSNEHLSPFYTELNRFSSKIFNYPQIYQQQLTDLILLILVKCGQCYLELRNNNKRKINLLNSTSSKEIDEIQVMRHLIKNNKNYSDTKLLIGENEWDFGTFNFIQNLSHLKLIHRMKDDGDLLNYMVELLINEISNSKTISNIINNLS
ncbi:hypothetical protein SNEBB_010607 [Seison nebaliae]|nr:hypothetical protein SNEBB_010607 [Seison nebaliae]